MGSRGWGTRSWFSVALARSFWSVGGEEKQLVFLSRDRVAWDCRRCRSVGGQIQAPGVDELALDLFLYTCSDVQQVVPGMSGGEKV